MGIGRPKGYVVTPETRAKISATMRERGVKPVMNPKPPCRPARGTDEYRLFRKIADKCGLGAVAAHAELRRGAHG